MRDPREIILAPVVSEKTTDLAQEGKYVFRVAPDANKVEIRRAVEELWKVKVRKVNTVRVRGKFRRMGWHRGYTSGWKKAFVTLEPGQSIDLG